MIYVLTIDSSILGILQRNVPPAVYVILVDLGREIAGSLPHARKANLPMGHSHLIQPNYNTYFFNFAERTWNTSLFFDQRMLRHHATTVHTYHTLTRMLLTPTLTCTSDQCCYRGMVVPLLPTQQVQQSRRACKCNTGRSRTAHNQLFDVRLDESTRVQPLLPYRVYPHLVSLSLQTLLWYAYKTTQEYLL